MISCRKGNGADASYKYFRLLDADSYGEKSEDKIAADVSSLEQTLADAHALQQALQALQELQAPKQITPSVANPRTPQNPKPSSPVQVIKTPLLAKLINQIHEAEMNDDDATELIQRIAGQDIKRIEALMTDAHTAGNAIDSLLKTPQPAPSTAPSSFTPGWPTLPPPADSPNYNEIREEAGS